MFYFKKIPKIVLSTERITNFNGPGLRRGESYLIKEPKPERSFQIFTNMVKGICMECPQKEAFPCESIGCNECTFSCPCKRCGHARAQGLCFTRDPPEGLRERYLLQTTPIFWISKHGTGSVYPASLEIMVGMINEFIRMSKNPIILLDGLEFLCIMNGFIPVIKFLHDIRDRVILNGAILILPLDPAALDKKELALIERNMKAVECSS
ncbi:Uncharacterised protein [uncultured archaeon]|nr:Uncharacterised protein [uncultured archaeon]